jgi:hypothetical protein
MHRPNEYYLEYVADDVAKAAIDHVITTCAPQVISEPASPSPDSSSLTKRSSSSYLSHNRSFQFLTTLVTNWLSDFTVGDGSFE